MPERETDPTPATASSPQNSIGRQSEDDAERAQLKIAGHIFENSPTMLALCLTVIGLIKIYTNLEKITTLADNCLAFGVVSFLCSTVLSYLALRGRTHKGRLRYAQIADVMFLVGLCSAAAVAVFITFALAG